MYGKWTMCLQYFLSNSLSTSYFSIWGLYVQLRIGVMITGDIWEEALDEFIEDFSVTADVVWAAAGFHTPRA